ncbi:sugar phosphate isomerase/epimerase family protein [Actinoalloteichus spitiensis]|uniref:sugar phosphate isomerase/epimerase family protein n=1 Tax=Actinoalloteichus spitiensis TaxID=252394 RepID=UPI00037F2D02|nr:sugar phosphate isomerase/epimerase family protein [Actinoalloteichus spitiensis]
MTSTNAVPRAGADLSRLSLNQATTKYADLETVVAECVRAGIPGVGLWREPVAEYGLARSAALVRKAGLQVTSLCRGGFFTASDPGERAAALEENRRAVDECAELGTSVLVLVSGGLPAGSTDVDGARERVADALGELGPYARERGVRLAVEPLHPMFCSDRCVISTLDQAVDLANRFPADQVGVVVDAYHVWWDPNVYRAIERAGERIASYQVCDWVTPLPADVLLGRGMMGDGCVELARLREAVERAGYDGPIEVEIFNQELWDTAPRQVVDLTVERYLRHVW